MSTTPNTPDPIQYAVYDSAGQVVETAATQVEAFNIIDWLVIHEPAAGPYRTSLTLMDA